MRLQEDPDGKAMDAFRNVGMSSLRSLTAGHRNSTQAALAVPELIPSFGDAIAVPYQNPLTAFTLSATILVEKIPV